MDVPVDEVPGVEVEAGVEVEEGVEVDVDVEAGVAELQAEKRIMMPDTRVIRAVSNNLFFMGYLLMDFCLFIILLFNSQLVL